MTSPLSKIVEWFEALPPEVANQISAIGYTSIAALVGLQFDPSKDEPGPSFLAWLKQPGDLFADLSKVLLAKEQIKFFFLDEFSTAEHWERNKADNVQTLAKAKGDPKFELIASRVQQMIDDHPRRSTLFIASGDQWREDVAPAVSDDAVRAWFDFELKN